MTNLRKMPLRENKNIEKKIIYALTVERNAIGKNVGNVLKHVLVEKLFNQKMKKYDTCYECSKEEFSKNS